ncbi:MAG: cation transporter [Ignavibacteriaceae bacterium]|jgi:divalent metal cation (Fe/Co/Zn/Cd) transporter|nr:cation transporter [Ignavibacteriaceae bacterium]
MLDNSIENSLTSDRLYKKGLRLEFFTVGYNILEAVAALLLGGIASSIALIGFGLDSIVESLSGGVLIWRLSKGRTLSKEHEEKIEERAQKFVAVTFFVLGSYVLVESVLTLWEGNPPETSLGGIILAILSLIIMPLLGKAKMKIGRQLNSRALMADAKETFACAFLSAALLLGLAANYFWGFWQADPLAGFVIVYYLIKEGKENWEGECECN